MALSHPAVGAGAASEHRRGGLCTLRSSTFHPNVAAVACRREGGHLLLVRSFPLPLRPPPPPLGSAANHKAHFEPTVSPRHVCNGCEFSLVTSVSQPADARLALAFGRCRGGRGCRGPAWRLRDGSHLGRGGAAPSRVGFHPAVWHGGRRVI